MTNHVLITGCSTGIGLQSAKTLKARGYRVIATARSASDLEMLGKLGFYAVRMEMTDYGSINQALAQIAQITGCRLYGVFHNAGYGQPGAIEDLSVSALERQMRANVFGAHHVNRTVVRWMRTAGAGRIIWNSSVMGVVVMPYRGAYAASKFAMEAIADAMRLELPSTIHVSLLEPGPIDTLFRATSLQRFREEVEVIESAHHVQYKTLEARLGKVGPTSKMTLAPSACVDALIHALESPKPRNRYRITTLTKMSWLMKRILPSRIIDRLLANRI